MPSNIRIRGGTHNTIEGDYTKIDRSCHETNMESYNIYRTEVTDAFNNSDGQRQEDYSRPPLSQPQFQSTPHQTSSASSRVYNQYVNNIENKQIDNAFNDNSEHHYYGPAPTANQRARPQDQTHKLPQFIGNGVLPQSIQQIDQRFRQAFSNRSLSEGNVAPTMPRNNLNVDDESDENNDSNKPPPLSTSSSEPIYRTYKGNLTKYDNSKHQTNISSFNKEGVVIRNSFNDKISDDYLRHGKEGGDKPGVEACLWFNSQYGCRFTESTCKYQHTCQFCGQAGHGKASCGKGN